MSIKDIAVYNVENDISTQSQFMNAGVTGAATPTLTLGAGGATVDIATCNATLYDNANYTGKPKNYLISAMAGIVMVDDSTNYIYIDYNGGSPIYSVTTDKTVINSSSKIPVNSVTREGVDLHPIPWDAMGTGAVNKFLEAASRLSRFTRFSGLIISANASREVSFESGVVFKIYIIKTLLDAVDPNVDNLYTYEYNGSGWTKHTETAYNNTHYQGASGFTELSPQKWTVNWIYRGVGSEKHIFSVLGTEEFGNQADAEESLPREVADLPPLIASNCIIVGRIAVQDGNVAPANGVNNYFE